MTTVWVTRTRPGAEATAERVRGLGFTPIVAPLLEVVFEPGGQIDLAGVTALAFTSANGVRAFLARAPTRDLPVFTVGKGTASAAREAGFVSVTASQGDVLTLAEAIPMAGLVLHPGAAEPAADLVEALGRRGIRARGVVVYRTAPVTLTPAELERAANADFVLLQSAKAAKAFRDLRLQNPRPICLSEAIASLLPLREKVAAKRTDEGSRPTLNVNARRDNDAETSRDPSSPGSSPGQARLRGPPSPARGEGIASIPTEEALMAALVEAAE